MVIKTKVILLLHLTLCIINHTFAHFDYNLTKDIIKNKPTSTCISRSNTKHRFLHPITRKNKGINAKQWRLDFPPGSVSLTLRHNRILLKHKEQWLRCTSYSGIKSLMWHYPRLFMTWVQEAWSKVLKWSWGKVQTRNPSKYDRLLGNQFFASFMSDDDEPWCVQST